MSPRPLRRPREVFAVGGIVVTALLLAACSAKSGSSGTGGLVGPQPGTSVSVTSGSTTTVAPSTATSTPTSVTTSKTSGSGGGAHIVTFKVKQKPACPIIPTSDAPFSKEGTNIVLEWNVTGATKVALSLDNPGFFKTYHTGSIDDYSPKHTVDLSFQCDPTVQPNTTHKYTLDTIGGGATIERTITVTVQTSP
jgi:hypothetical protein